MEALNYPSPFCQNGFSNTQSASHKRKHEEEKRFQPNKERCVDSLAEKVLRNNQGADGLLGFAIEKAKQKNYRPLTSVLNQSNEISFKKLKALYDDGHRYPPILSRLSTYYSHQGHLRAAEEYLDCALQDEDY